MFQVFYTFIIRFKDHLKTQFLPFFYTDLEMAKPTFWKPGTVKPEKSLNEERYVAREESTSYIYNSNPSLSIQQQRQRLPVFRFRNHILYLLDNYQTVVIVGK